MLTIKATRILLPEESKGLTDPQVQFMISRIGEVSSEDLKAAWHQEYEAHLEEMALFLYDMYQESRHSESLDQTTNFAGTSGSGRATLDK